MADAPTGRALMDRVFNAGALLVAATVAVTGVFVVRISESYAQTHRSSTAPSNPGDGGFGGDQGGQGGQLSVPQNQQPLGGSNGS